MQALEQALHAVPDVVVTNLNIPGIDGFELTRRRSWTSGPGQCR
jgi:CheY-like chemotaxis protein